MKKSLIVLAVLLFAGVPSMAQGGPGGPHGGGPHGGRPPHFNPPPPPPHHFSIMHTGFYDDFYFGRGYYHRRVPCRSGIYLDFRIPIIF